MGKEEYRDANRDDHRPEKSSGSSRLGKEAKIGVTVIAVLLVALGVAVAMRLSGPNADDKQLAAAADRDGGKEKQGGQSKTDSLFKDSRSKRFGSGSGSLPTVVSAKAASSRPPKSTSGDLDQWKLASDRGDAKRTGGGPAISPSPSFMPDPPKPARGTESNARFTLPGEDSPRRSAKARTSRTDTSGYASTSDLPPALPPYRESARYENSTPAMMVGQYDVGEYRRESPEPRRHGSGQHRSAAASRYNDPPPRRDDGKYEVQPNDSYWTISERLFGTGAYFKALAEHNRGKDAGEDRLQPGALILAPALAELEKSYPDLCPKPSRREALQSQAQSRVSTVGTRSQYRGGRTYTVVEGDTLFNIARYELGKASRWAEIYDLNREVLGKDFNYLTPGTQLAMPEGEKSDVIAQPLGSGYRR